MKRKGIFKHIVYLVLFACFTLNFSSCDEDWWYDDWWEEEGWHDNYRAEREFAGRWYVDYCEEGIGRCPYWFDDEFNFFRDGRLLVNRTDGYQERGTWWIDNRFLLIDLNGDRTADMRCYMREFYRDFSSLEVRDFLAGSEYYLELVR